MAQIILLVIVFVAALIYFGRYVYRQIKSGGDEGHCDKCLSKDSLEKFKTKQS